MKANLMPIAKSGVSGLLNLVYPPICSLCSKKLLTEKQNSLSICSNCFSKIKKNLPPYCKKCGRSLNGLIDIVEVCWECAKRNFYYERSWSGFLYEGIIKDALHLLKYSKKVTLTNLFCSLFCQFVKATPEILKEIEAVIAVPLHSVKLREREFNQAHVLALAISKEFNIKDLSGCLKRSVATRPQNELDKKERFDNVKGTFDVVKPALICKKSLLIVDDLFTTGATLNECAKVLKKSGAGKIYCLTFARGQ